MVEGKPPKFIHLISIAYRRLHAMIQSDTDDRTAIRAGVLMALGEHSCGTPIQAIGEQLGLGASSLSGLLDRMEQDGLIARQRNPNDGRAFNIVLTELGRSRRAAALQSARLLNDQLCEGFDEAELATVARWLAAVAAKFPRGTSK